MSKHTLLQHTRKQASGLYRHVLQRGSSRLAPVRQPDPSFALLDRPSGRPTSQNVVANHSPDTAHGNTKQRPHRQKLRIGIDETGSELKDADEDQIADEGPLAPEAIGENTENDGAEGAEEEGERDGGGDLIGGLAELSGKRGDGEGDGKVVVAVTRPGEPSLISAIGSEYGFKLWLRSKLDGG